jgi:hypothetical protein
MESNVVDEFLIGINLLSGITRIGLCPLSPPIQGGVMGSVQIGERNNQFTSPERLPVSEGSGSLPKKII